MDKYYLKLWLNGIKSNHKRAKRTNRFIYANRALYIFYAFVLFILSVYSFNIEDIRSVLIFGALSLSIIVNIYILFLISKSSIIKGLNNSKLFFQLDKFGELGEEIKSIISNLKDSMKLITDLDVYINTKQFNLSPIVSKFKYKYLLLLPVGFLTEYSKSKNSIKPILAHELAHIKQGDIELWSSYSRLVRKYIVTFFLNAIIISLSFSIIFIESLFAYDDMHKYSMFARVEFFLISNLFISLVFPLLMVIQLRAYRKKSEELADLGSIAFTSKEEFIESLKLLKKSDNKNLYHLNTSERMKLIEKVPR